MARTGQPEERRGIAVLVVDDKPMVLDIARRLLESAGFRVRDASGGREAIRIYREHADDIDCVLLDLEMPDMSGESTCRGLRKIRADVKVIFSSGCDATEIRPRIGDEANVAYVQKPYRLNTLKALVRQVLGDRGPE